MRYVTVRKEELLGRLRENREKHRAIFEEALRGFQKEAVRLLQEQAERAKKGVRRTVYVHLECPEDHTRDYDRIIGMMEMEIAHQVQLSEQEFAQYVLDDWSWQRQWLTSSSRYSAAARELLERSPGVGDER